MGISSESLLTSLGCALVHLILEVLNLVVEAKTSDTNLAGYVVASYNARQAWVPQQHDFYNDGFLGKDEKF